MPLEASRGVALVIMITKKQEKLQTKVIYLILYFNLDGRRIVPPTSTEIGDNIIKMHPDFRMMVLANRFVYLRLS